MILGEVLCMMEISRNAPKERSAIIDSRRKPANPFQRNVFWPSALLAGVLCLLALVGCGVTGPEPCKNCDIDPPPSYPPRDTPARAVLYLEAGWEDLDSTRADTVFASTYEGTSVNRSDPGTGTLTFYKSDEIRALWGLKHDPEVRRITMTLPDTSLWTTYHDISDPADYVTMQINDPAMLLERTDDQNQGVHSKTFEFTARTKVEGGKTLWEIIRWTETHD